MYVTRKSSGFNDKLSNKASFSFVAYKCTDPKINPPINGDLTCQNFTVGNKTKSIITHCTIKCNTSKSFAKDTKPFYVCGYDGSWNPYDPDVSFTFPACATIENSYTVYKGLLHFHLPCNDSKTRKVLHEQLERVFESIDNKTLFHHKQRNLNLFCPLLSSSRRQKRDVVDGFDVRFDMHTK